WRQTPCGQSGGGLVGQARDYLSPVYDCANLFQHGSLAYGGDDRRGLSGRLLFPDRPRAPHRFSLLSEPTSVALVCWRKLGCTAPGLVYQGVLSSTPRG